MDSVLTRKKQSAQEPLTQAITSIIVHVDLDRGSDDRTRLAADLADRFGAALIGVAGWVPGRELTGHHGEFIRDEDRLKWISAELARLGERFRDVAGQPAKAVEWRASFHFAREVIARECRSADLVVIGMHSAPDDVFHTSDVGSILLAAGRPVLVVPDGLTKLSGQRIMVAWKETREARRAVRDALPFLQAAQQVLLFEVAEEAAESDEKAHLDDLEAYLHQHQIEKIAKRVVCTRGSVSAELKQAARAEAMDLIVAGAYGRTRLGEWVFGGVTHDLLRTSEICCLFSN